jgi:hypothetical protein
MTQEEFIHYLKRIDVLKKKGEEIEPTKILTLQLMVTVLDYVESAPRVNREWLEREFRKAGVK